MKKKLLAILMILSMVVCMMPAMAFAGTTEESDQSQTEQPAQTEEKQSVQNEESQPTENEAENNVAELEEVDPEESKATLTATDSWTTIGTCEYQIIENGDSKTLTIRPENNGKSGTLPDVTDPSKDDVAWPWAKTKEGQQKADRYTITSVVIEKGVKAGNSTRNMFSGFQNMESIDLSNFDTSNVVNMQQMFLTCFKLKELDLSKFNTSEVTNMSGMFNNCTSLNKIDVSSFNTSKVTDMSKMFIYCTSLTTLDLSSFDTSKVTNMTGMFKTYSSSTTTPDENLVTILVGEGWTVDNVEAKKSTDMFRIRKALKGGLGTAYDENKTQDNQDHKSYAHIDGGESNPGYLTSVDQYLADKTIVLKDGKAHADIETGVNITAAVASKGLKYVAATEGTPAHWEMNNFTFTTTAATALEFADNGTAETPVAININVVGTNSITGGSSDSASTYGMHFSGSNANFTISGADGASALNVVSGQSSESMAYSCGIGCGDSDNGSPTLTFTGLTANFTGGQSTKGYSKGANSYGNITVGNDAAVTFKSTGTPSATRSARGIHMVGSSALLKVEGTGKLVASCQNLGTKDTAVWAKQAPDASAVLTDTETGLTWDLGSKTYKDSDGNIATNVTLTSAASITVGDQTGTLTYGTAESATYDVSLTGVTEPDSFTVAWFDKDNKALSDAPAGVTASYNKETDKFTVNKTAATPAGTYKFTLTSGGVTSDKATVTVGAKNISGCTISDITVQTYSGKQITPEPVVKDGETTLVKSTDYTVSYDSNVNAGTNAGKVTITGTGNYTGTKDATFDISKVTITLSNIQAQNKKYDGNTAAEVTFDKSGIIEEDDVEVNYTADFYDGTDKDKKVGENKTVKIAFSLSGDKSGNYKLNELTDTATASITTKELTVEDTRVNGKEYDGNTTAVVGITGNLSGVVDKDDVEIATTTATFDGKDVKNGRDATISYTLTGDDAANYTVKDSTTKADIEKATITVTPDSGKTAQYLYEDPEFTYTSSGAVSGETAAFEGALSRESGDNVTETGYKITLGTLALKDNGDFKASNYELKLNETPVYFKITKAKVALPSTKTDLVYNGKKQTGVTTLFGAPYKVTGTKSATDAGTYTATAALNNTNNYEWDVETPTTDDQQIEWKIAPKAVNVKAESKSTKQYEELSPLTYVADELIGEDTYEGELATEADPNKTGNYAITQGTLTAGDNYSINFIPGTYTVVQPYDATKFLAQGKAYKRSIKYSWNKVSGATKYKVYWAKCGKKLKLVKTTSGTSYTKKSLRRKATYKAYVVAYNKSGKKLATTPLIHNMTTKGGRSNATAVSAKKTASVKAGSKVNVKAKISKKDSKKTLLWKNHASAAIRYYSANSKVATVDAKGNVKGVKAGTANIYAVAPSGVSAVTKVTVKAK